MAMVPMLVTALKVRLAPRVCSEVNARDLPTMMSSTEICRGDVGASPWSDFAMFTGSNDMARLSFSEREVEPI